MKIQYKFWKGLGRHVGRVLGGSWASFGKGLGRSWVSSGRSWPPLGPLGRLLDASWALKSQQYHNTSDFFRFLVDLERDFGGFGKVWGGIWEDLGRLGEESRRILVPLSE